MIAKHVKRTKDGSYSRLANYIGGLAEYVAGTNDQEEKLDHFWAVNSNACEGLEDKDHIKDIDHIIAEIAATQSMNTRAKGDKTYHLIVSFRDEFGPVEREIGEDLADFEARQDKRREGLVAIERHFAKKLGFEDHQRIAATHTNTDNFHMHIAFNKINPKTGNILHPSHDFKKLERACRVVERGFGLKVDRGRSDVLERNPMPVKARDMESHTWQKSFFGYVEGLKPEIKDIKTAANSWDDLHLGLEEYGLKIEKKGNGLIISDLAGDNGSIKASSFSKDFGKPALEKEFGAFAEPSVVVEEVAEYASAVSAEIKDICSAAENWEDVHAVFNKYDLNIKTTGADLTIEHAASAGAGFGSSALGPEFERDHLEERLGAFTPPADGYESSAAYEASAQFEEDLMKASDSYDPPEIYEGLEVGSEVGAEVGAEVGPEVGAEMGLQLEIDIDADTDADADTEVHGAVDEDLLLDDEADFIPDDVSPSPDPQLLEDDKVAIEKKAQQSALKKASFSDYVMGLSEDIEALRENSKSWQDLHKGLDEHGLRIGLRGNGVVISDSNHKSRKIKGSDLGRQFSKSSLEKHLGPFEKYQREQGTFAAHVQDALLGLEGKLDEAKSWEYIHGFLRTSGLELKVRKNIFKKEVMVVRDANNHENEVHSNSFGKQFSKSALEARLGRNNFNELTEDDLEGLSKAEVKDKLKKNAVKSRAFKPSRKGDFGEYVEDVLPNLDEWRKVARSWESLHKTFNYQGLKLEVNDENLTVSDKYDPSRKVDSSALGDKFNKKALEKQLRRPFRQSYEDIPLTPEEEKMEEWRKFRAGRDNGGVASFAYRNWRNFMLVEGDLLAITLIINQQKMIEGLFDALGSSKDKDGGMGR